ncbi:exonuclease [Aureimonas ureilytica]|uniref:Exonuclease n=2 Tax=Aureimonas ureilytica TaxID=401562 RepID=A0A175RQA3_9HYPH|nr:exonuclease [Aureimonas ureilytica]
MDVYFSADVETDGPIPGPFSMLSFAIVFAGTYDGREFKRADTHEKRVYHELKPISSQYEQEALDVNGLDRQRLLLEGEDPKEALTKAANWIREIAGEGSPVLVAYPLSFDWTWLYWYFVNYCEQGSPFDYSKCYDIKTALSVKTGMPIAQSGRSSVPSHLRSHRLHTHHAIDDAIEQAEIFANLFEWEPPHGRDKPQT